MHIHMADSLLSEPPWKPIYTYINIYASILFILVNNVILSSKLLQHITLPQVIKKNAHFLYILDV